MITLRALGALLVYPDRELREALPEISAVIEASTEIGPTQRKRLSQLVSTLGSGDPFDVEEAYVELFDRTPSASLHLFEHLHGESRDRGAAMVDLKAVYERAGFQLRPDQLPDYLPALLEYLSCRSVAEARAMLGDCAHILCAVGQRLVARSSPYAAVFDALLVFAGEPALDYGATPSQPESAPDIDESWMDAPAFGPTPQSGIPEGAAPASPAMGCARASAEAPLRHMPQARRGGTRSAAERERP